MAAEAEARRKTRLGAEGDEEGDGGDDATHTKPQGFIIRLPLLTTNKVYLPGEAANACVRPCGTPVRVRLVNDSSQLAPQGSRWGCAWCDLVLEIQIDHPH